MSERLSSQKHDLMLYAFAFWYATEVFLGVNLEMVADISIHLLSELQAVVTLGLLAIQIAWFQEYTRREFFCIAGVSLLLLVTMLTSDIRSLFSAWLFIVAAKNSDFEKCVQIAYKILIVTVIAVVLLYLCRVIPDPMIYRGDVWRPSFGFTHPNTFGMRVFQLMACHCYLKRERFRWWDGALLLVLAGFIYAVPNSQTATVGLLFIFVVMLGVRLKVKISTWWAIALTVCLPVVSIAMSFIDVKNYPILARVDRLLSSRFSNAHKVWQMYGVRWFGNRIYVSAQERALVGIEERLWLDNAYCYIMLRYGIVVLFLFMIGYLYMMYWHGKHGNGLLVCYLFLFAIYGVEEIYLQMLSYNIFLLAMAPALYVKGEAHDKPPEIYFSLQAWVRKIKRRDNVA